MPCQQNTLAFTNSILNEEAMTEGNISGSLKMRAKRETFLPPVYEAKLVWTDVPWNLQMAQSCAQEGYGFLRPESEIFLLPNFNQRGLLFTIPT